MCAFAIWAWMLLCPVPALLGLPSPLALERDLKVHQPAKLAARACRAGRALAGQRILRATQWQPIDWLYHIALKHSTERSGSRAWHL